MEKTLNLLSDYLSITDEYTYTNITSLWHPTVARRVVAPFPFPVTLMLSLAVLQGALDVLQGCHTFHLFFLRTYLLCY